MKWILPAFLLFALPAHADCDLDGISKALEAGLARMKPKEIDALESQSTEGGIWQVYREKDGRLNTIIRLDGGESGKNETRLSVVNRTAWGIESTRFDYIRHAFADDGSPFGYAKKTTDIYYFCDGKLYLPGAQWGTVGEDYAKAGGEARNTIFAAKEIAAIIKGLAR